MDARGLGDKAKGQNFLRGGDIHSETATVLRTRLRSSSTFEDRGFVPWPNHHLSTLNPIILSEAQPRVSPVAD